MPTKPWFKSWTVLFAIAAAFAETCQQLMDLFPSGKFHQVLSVSLIASMFVLRLRTKTAIEGFGGGGS